MELSMIVDLILLAVLFGSAFYYARRGFAAGIVQMVGSFVSLVAASVAAKTAWWKRPVRCWKTRAAPIWRLWWSGLPAFCPTA